MELSILGPLEVRRDGRAVDLGSRKARVVLAALAVRAPEVVSVDALADAVWGDRPPAQAAVSLRSYVSRLRRALGEERFVLVTQWPGYRLVVDEEIDARRFERLVTRARDRLALGHLGDGETMLREALRMFRGPPLAEFRDAAFATDAARRLDELRLVAMEDRIAADLALGRAPEVVSELESLVTALPLREQVWRHLMTALYRVGRQADALHAYRRVRVLLDEQLGVEPAPETRALERRILDHDPALLAPAPIVPSPASAPGSTPPDAPLPAALRAACAGACAGRTALQARLESRAPGTTTLVLGEPGIGKTRLVAEHARTRWAAGAVVWFGGCTRAGIAYEPFVEALDTYLGDDRAVELAGRIPEAIAVAARLVPGLASRARLTVAPAVEPPSALEVVRAVEAIVAEVARRQPVLVVLDDLQWADPETLRLLSRLVGTAGRVDVRYLLVARAPTRPDRHPLAALQREHHLDALRLEGLGVGDLTDLVRDADAGTPSAPVARALHERTAGNPYFVHELIRAHGGRLPERVEDLHLGPTEGIRAAIDARLETLTDDARRALEVVAVGGDRVDHELLEAVGGDALLDALDEAASAGLLREGGPGHVELRPTFVRDALLAEMGPTRRRRLHRRIGRALEPLLSDEPDRLHEVAHHFAASGVAALRRRAAELLRTAGHHARRDRRFEAAARRAEHAAELTADDPAHDPADVAELLVEAGEALIDAGRRHESHQVGRRALAVATSSGSPTLAARATLLCAPRRPDPSAAPLLEAALRPLAPHDGALRAALEVELGWSLADADGPRAAALVRSGRSRAERTGSIDAWARALDHEWEWHGAEVEPAVRLAAADALLAAAERADHRRGTISALIQRVIALLELADVAGATRAIARHERLADDHATPEFLALRAQRTSMLALLRGDFDAAERFADEALLHVPGDPSFAPIYLGQIAAVRKEQGRLDGLAELVLADPVNRDRPIARAGVAMFLAETGRPEESRAVLRELERDGLDALPPDMWRLVTLANVADAAIVLRDRSAAEHAYARLAPHSGRVVTFGYGAVCWGLVDRFLAPLAALLDRPGPARDHYELALATHERMGAVSFVARDQLGLARLLSRSHDDAGRAQALAAAATTTARALGMGGLLAEANAPVAGSTSSR